MLSDYDCDKDIRTLTVWLWPLQAVLLQMELHRWVFSQKCELTLIFRVSLISLVDVSCLFGNGRCGWQTGDRHLILNEGIRVLIEGVFNFDCHISLGIKENNVHTLSLLGASRNAYSVSYNNSTLVTYDHWIMFGSKRRRLCVCVFSGCCVVFYVLTPETTMISGDNRATASDLVFVGPEMCTHNFHIRWI